MIHFEYHADRDTVTAQATGTYEQTVMEFYMLMSMVCKEHDVSIKEMLGDIKKQSFKVLLRGDKAGYIRKKLGTIPQEKEAEEESGVMS